MLWRALSLFLCLCLLACPAKASATDKAFDLTAECDITADGASASSLTDNNVYTYRSVGEIVIKSQNPLFGLYVKFDRLPEKWVLTADGTVTECGDKGFLHEFVPLNGAVELTLSFENKASVADVFLYGEGDIPDTVQRWEIIDKADIMVCPTHSDDDQLYFAGMIPWCIAKGYDVQVVYFTNHWNTHDRPHELLDGLWHCGLKYYPYIPDHPDLYSLSLSEAEAAFGVFGYNKEYLTEFYIDLFERYKPLVVAGHDINGEYGHGAHMLNSTVLMDAVLLSAERGVWDVPKTYIHSWKENAVVFNWDIPMEELGGKTPFEVSQEGYAFHHSQHRFESLSRWLYGTDAMPITKAAQIYSHSPCRYGLFRSTVGYDTEENSIFQNLKSHKEQAAEKVPPPDTPPEEPPVIQEPPRAAAVFSGEDVRRKYLQKNGEEFLIQKPLVFEPAVDKDTKNNELTVYVAVLAGIIVFCIAITIIKSRKNKNAEKNKA